MQCASNWRRALWVALAEVGPPLCTPRKWALWWKEEWRAVWTCVKDTIKIRSWVSRGGDFSNRHCAVPTWTTPHPCTVQQQMLPTVFVCVSLNQSFNNCCFTQKHSYLAAKQCGISAYSQSCPLAELSSTYGKSTCRDFCSHKWRSCPLLSKRWFLPRSPASNAQFTKSPLSRTLICPLLLHVERHPTAAFRFLLLSLSSLLLSLPPPRLWKRERADEPLCG